jgi:glycerophosphoryl diester phosphodiesterase
MLRQLTACLCGWGTLLAQGPEADTPRAVAPLERAHAHNDYEHARPLWDALDHGFCSVEADVHLVDGRLLVAHDRGQVRPERTLEALYLEPLNERVRANGGRVFRGGPTFWLLIDFKADGQATWQVLEPLLERYRHLLTAFETDATHTNAVAVVISGNAPREALLAPGKRLAALDGRVPDLDASPTRHRVPWISASWSSQFQWRGEGTQPASEATRLRELVARAQAQGRQVRFWGTPDVEVVWQVQWRAGVDWINTDRLAALAAFLRDAR